jgi:hypothetical protein
MLGKLIVVYLLKKFFSFYEFQRLIIMHAKFWEVDIKQEKKCSSESSQASLRHCEITEARLHVTDTRVNLTLDKDNERVVPKQVVYEQTVPKDKNDCKEYQVQIQVSSSCVTGFPLQVGISVILAIHHLHGIGSSLKKFLLLSQEIP